MYETGSQLVDPNNKGLPYRYGTTEL